MSATSSVNLFIVWRIFQRRSESLSAEFDLVTKYYYYSWEEKSKFHQAWSYIYKTVRTLYDLIRSKPSVVFIQLPPTPLLYIAYGYCKLSGCKLVADCHNGMIYYSKWLNWPFAKAVLGRADALLVHNEDVERDAGRFGLRATTMRDPLPNLTNTEDRGICAKFGLTEGRYVIVPWSFAPDEPVDELMQAAQLMPEIKFVMTWFAERLPQNIRSSLPPNLVLTGYLEDVEFNAVFSQAAAAIVLTKREGTQPSGASEAIVLGVPLIISDLQTTRKLYGDMPIYVDNTVDGIRFGVQQVLEDKDSHKARIVAFKETFSRCLEKEISGARVSLGLSKQETASL